LQPSIVAGLKMMRRSAAIVRTDRALRDIDCESPPFAPQSVTRLLKPASAGASDPARTEPSDKQGQTICFDSTITPNAACQTAMQDSIEM
jgi:hypothetical protein